MLKRLLSAVFVGLFLFSGSAAAEESTPKGLEGSFTLKGSNGYEIFGLIGATGKGDAGVLQLFVGKKGEEATYLVHGTVTREAVDFDLGALGEVDLTVQPTGKTETLTPACGGGEKTTIEGYEYVGTLAFHGEEGFTEAEATHTPLSLAALGELVCGTVTSEGKEGGDGVRGAGLSIKRKGGPSLALSQNHPGASVYYRARLHEKEGSVTVDRSVGGYLPGRAMTYAPSLGSAHLSGSSPFAGAATFAGRSKPSAQGPGKGSWRGNLTVDFPGHAAVPLTGRGFKATIFAVHRDKTRTVEPD